MLITLSVQFREFESESIVTGSLGKSTLNNGYITLQNTKDHGGQKMPLLPKQLVVSPTQAMLAKELLGSPDDPTTANRSINWLNDWTTEIVVWPLLT